MFIYHWQYLLMKLYSKCAASAGIRSTFGTLFKAFPQIQHLVAAGLKAAIFAVSGLGVDDLAAVFTLDSAHTGGRHQ